MNLNQLMESIEGSTEIVETRGDMKRKIRSTKAEYDASSLSLPGQEKLLAKLIKAGFGVKYNKANNALYIHALTHMSDEDILKASSIDYGKMTTSLRKVDRVLKKKEAQLKRIAKAHDLSVIRTPTQTPNSALYFNGFLNMTHEIKLGEKIESVGTFESVIEAIAFIEKSISEDISHQEEREVAGFLSNLQSSCKMIHGKQNPRQRHMDRIEATLSKAPSILRLLTPKNFGNTPTLKKVRGLISGVESAKGQSLLASPAFQKLCAFFASNEGNDAIATLIRDVNRMNKQEVVEGSLEQSVASFEKHSDLASQLVDLWMQDVKKGLRKKLADAQIVIPRAMRKDVMHLVKAVQSFPTYGRKITPNVVQSASQGLLTKPLFVALARLTRDLPKIKSDVL